MKYIIYILILFTAHIAHADTVLTDGAMRENTTFTKAKSPYVFNQNTTVLPGVILTVEKGVRLVFNQGSLFLYKGRLMGGEFTIESRISNQSFMIQCATCNIDIHDVHVEGVARSVVSAWDSSVVAIDGIDISFSNTEQNTVGVQVFNSTSLTVQHSSFARLGKAFDIFTFSTSTIKSSSFMYNTEAIYAFNSELEVHENDFEYNHIAIEFFDTEENLTLTDAHNNWWGKADHPQIYRDDIGQVQQSDINALVGVIIYDPWSLLPYKKKEVAPDVVSNVLFLPGLMGSRLYTKDIFENQLWEPNRNGDVKKLYLDSSGKSIQKNIYTRDIIGKTNILEGVTSVDTLIYKDFQTYMDGLVSSKKMQSWKAEPYDWRYAPDTILSDGIVKGDGKKQSITHLVSDVISLANVSKTKKVTLITHSNGGLLGKQLMIELKKQKLDMLIDRIIFVAMPEYGTPQAITALLYGHAQAVAGGFILSTSVAKALGIHMPTAYSLLPSDAYLAHTSLHIDGVHVADRKELDRILYNKLEVNSTLLTQSESLHAVLDTWTPPPYVSVYQILGTGVPTVSGFTTDSKGNPVPQYTSSGDGTVQDMYESDKSSFARTGHVFIDDLHNTSFTHVNIMNSTKTLNHIDRIIRKNPKEVSDIPFGPYPVYDDSFTLFKITASGTPLSSKMLSAYTDARKDILQHSTITQFDYTYSKNSAARFDLIDTGVQYISQKPIQKIDVQQKTNDVFDLQIFTSNTEGMQEVLYEDIQLLQDSVLTYVSSNINQESEVYIDIPLLNQKIQISPTETYLYTSTGQLKSLDPSSSTSAVRGEDFATKITRIKNQLIGSRVTGYIKERYIRRLDTLLKTKDPGALISLKKSLEVGIKAIDSFSNNQMLRTKYAKLKQDYVYLVYIIGL